MTIDELNALTTLTAADEVPVWDSEESGEPTKKITASNLAASVKSLARLPNTTEMNTAIQQSTANYAKIKTFIINEEKTLPTGSSVLTITPPAGVTADIVKLLVLGSAWNNTYYAWNPQSGERYMNTQNTWTFNANNMRGAALTTSTFFAVVLY